MLGLKLICVSKSGPWKHALTKFVSTVNDPVEGDQHITVGHYSDIIMSTMASQITGVSIVYSTVCSGATQRKHQRSTSLAFVRGIHRWPVDSSHKIPVTRKMFPFGDVIMITPKGMTGGSPHKRNDLWQVDSPLKRNYRWPVDSHQKRPLIWKACQCHDWRVIAHNQWNWFAVEINPLTTHLFTLTQNVQLRMPFCHCLPPDSEGNSISSIEIKCLFESKGLGCLGESSNGLIRNVNQECVLNKISIWPKQWSQGQSFYLNQLCMTFDQWSIVELTWGYFHSNCI